MAGKNDADGKALGTTGRDENGEWIFTPVYEEMPYELIDEPVSTSIAPWIIGGVAVLILGGLAFILIHKRQE